MLSFRDVRSHR